MKWKYCSLFLEKHWRAVHVCSDNFDFYYLKLWLHLLCLPLVSKATTIVTVSSTFGSYSGSNVLLRQHWNLDFSIFDNQLFCWLWRATFGVCLKVLHLQCACMFVSELGAVLLKNRIFIVVYFFCSRRSFKLETIRFNHVCLCAKCIWLFLSVIFVSVSFLSFPSSFIYRPSHFLTANKCFQQQPAELLFDIERSNW